MDVDQEVRRLAADLAARHPLFAAQTVERLVARLFEEYAHARVRAYLPILVGREADSQLCALDRDFTGRLPARRVWVRDGAPVVV